MQSATTHPSAPRIEDAVRHLAGMIERDELTAALEAARTLRTQVPHNRDVLLLHATVQRRLGSIREAQDTLATLAGLHPAFAPLHRELGHCRAALNARDAAIESHSRAVILNPDLKGSWVALQSLFAAKGLRAEADNAGRHAARIAALPEAVALASELFANGDLAAAEELVRRHLQTHGEEVEGLRLLARIAMHFDAARDAQLLLERALARQPQHGAAREEYVTVLLHRQRHAQALEQLRGLRTADPGRRQFRILQAAAWAGLGDYARALPSYRELIAETPDQPELHLTLAHALKALGHTQPAIDEYRRAAALDPGCGEAFWSLANLKTYRFSDREIDHMRRVESDAPTPERRYPLCFALGKALEDRGRFAESFAFYERGNALKLAEIRPRPEDFERAAALQSSLFTADFFAARTGFGCASNAPIFIVGLPRSGSTLIEQILASHSRVEATMELAEIPRLAQDLHSSSLAGSTAGYPEVLAELDGDSCRRLGERYLLDAQAYRAGKPRFVDKMPNNFMHLGLIHLILPHARIIDARREPMACAFSLFKQLFAAGQRFAYSMDHIARYYRMYVDLMAHWDSVLPSKVLRVRHEDVVRDLEGQTRRLLDFCGLDFEPVCLEFHKTRRAVHSASSEQVHRPIFTDGVDQWRHFEPWLDPLKRALGPLVDDHA